MRLLKDSTAAGLARAEASKRSNRSSSNTSGTEDVLPAQQQQHADPSDLSRLRQQHPLDSQVGDIDKSRMLAERQKAHELLLKDVEYTVVPKGTVWLQGDNILNSTDSRVYGPVPYAMLRGCVSHKVCTCFGLT